MPPAQPAQPSIWFLLIPRITTFIIFSYNSLQNLLETFLQNFCCIWTCLINVRKGRRVRLQGLFAARGCPQVADARLCDPSFHFKLSFSLIFFNF